MTRLQASDITFSFTPSANMLVIIQDAIDDLYRLCADIVSVTYSSTVPDTSTMFGMIRQKIRAHFDIEEHNRANPTNRMPIVPLMFDDKERKVICLSYGATFTVDSTSKYTTRATKL